MRYIQVETETDEELLEPLTGFLLARGIEETAVEDPADLEGLLNKEEGYEWDYISDEVMKSRGGRPRLSFYLEETAENRRLASSLAVEIRNCWPGARVRVISEDDSQWKDKWKEYFKPARITGCLTVKPTWEDYIPEPGEKIIEIDPGMAFGTGTHETTSLCLRLMEKYMADKDRARVLDVGCGSGILSIGAALLGAEKILAVDIDPEAVRVTEENVRLNHVDDRVTSYSGNLVDGLDFRADIVVANLMADLVMELSPHVPDHLLPGGVYISSGILVEKADHVASAIRDAGFETVEIKEDGMWCAIAARFRG